MRVTFDREDKRERRKLRKKEKNKTERNIIILIIPIKLFKSIEK